jgi:cysteine synthase A
LLPPNLDASQIDEVHWLSDREAFASAWRLAAEQAVFGGNTSGSVYRVLGHVARTAAPGSKIVGIFPDRGDRYYGSVYSPEYWAQHGLDQVTEREAPQVAAYGTPVEQWSYCLLTDRAAPQQAATVPGGLVAADTAKGG